MPPVHRFPSSYILFFSHFRARETCTLRTPRTGTPISPAPATTSAPNPQSSHTDRCLPTASPPQTPAWTPYAKTPPPPSPRAASSSARATRPHPALATPAAPPPRHQIPNQHTHTHHILTTFSSHSDTDQRSVRTRFASPSQTWSFRIGLEPGEEPAFRTPPPFLPANQKPPPGPSPVEATIATFRSNTKILPSLFNSVKQIRRALL